MSMRLPLKMVVALGCLGLFQEGCFWIRPSRGGGQVDVTSKRSVESKDVALPAGYQIEAVAQRLTFPTAVLFDEDNQVYVIESGYSYGEKWAMPRLLRFKKEGRPEEVSIGEKGPWTGGSYKDGYFYISEGGYPGRILKISKSGEKKILVDGLPSQGDHHTDRAVIAPDGYVYFGQGTITNSGIVGLDDAQFGWLERHPALHDVPCRDITLTGENFQTYSPLSKNKGEKMLTGAFSSYGTPTEKGQVVKGQVPCSGAIMRVPAMGGAVELVAWGFRNPFGLAFSPEGKLYVTDNGYDDRGSRPIHGAGDYLWAVDIQNPGLWYGWPDFSGGEPLISGGYQPPGESAPKYLLLKHPNKPPKTVVQLGVHSSSNGFDFSRSADFGHPGDAFIAEFGDMAPTVGKVLAPVGFKVVRVEMKDGIVHEFIANRGKTLGPATWVGSHGIERPVDVKFNNLGTTMWVVDFGIVEMNSNGANPYPGTGVLWRVTHPTVKNVAGEP